MYRSLILDFECRVLDSELRVENRALVTESPEERHAPLRLERALQRTTNLEFKGN